MSTKGLKFKHPKTEAESVERARAKRLRWYYKNKEKQKEYKRSYDANNFKNNKSEFSERSALYYKTNKEKVDGINKIYRVNNKEAVKESCKRWNRTEKGKISKLLSANKRRLRIENTDIKRDWLLKLKKEAVLCPLCKVKMCNDGSKYPEGKHLDHIIPINIGGEHMKANVRFICYKCNISRPKDGSDLL